MREGIHVVTNSCFEKDCPTKSVKEYVTMERDIMANSDSKLLD